MILALRILHVAVAAAWFGHKLLIPSDLRHSLDDPNQASCLLLRLQRAERLGIATGMGTLVTGTLLILTIGPGSVSLPVYIGLGFILIAIGIGAFVARPASIELRRLVGEGSLALARRPARGLTRVLTIEGILWSAALVTMLI